MRDYFSQSPVTKQIKQVYEINKRIIHAHEKKLFPFFLILCLIKSKRSIAWRHNNTFMELVPFSLDSYIFVKALLIYSICIKIMKTIFPFEYIYILL